MKKTTLIGFASVLGGIILLVAPSPVSAGITYRVAPALDGGVDVKGKGTGVWNRPDAPYTTDDWDVNDFTTNFIATLTGATRGAATESGTFTNTTTGQSVNIISFQFDDDFGTELDNDIDFDTDAPITFSHLDEMRFSLTAHFNPPPGGSTMSIADFVKGTHIDLGNTDPNLPFIAEESFGITTVIVIPEPGTIALVMACCCSVGFAGGRKRNR